MSSYKFLRSPNVRSAVADPAWASTASLNITNVDCDHCEDVGVSFRLYVRSHPSDNDGARTVDMSDSEETVSSDAPGDDVSGTSGKALLRPQPEVFIYTLCIIRQC